MTADPIVALLLIAALIAASASAEIVDVATPSPAGNSITGCPRKSITALSPL